MPAKPTWRTRIAAALIYRGPTPKGKLAAELKTDLKVLDPKLRSMVSAGLLAVSVETHGKGQVWRYWLLAEGMDVVGGKPEPMEPGAVAERMVDAVCEGRRLTCGALATRFHVHPRRVPGMLQDAVAAGRIAVEERWLERKQRWQKRYGPGKAETLPCEAQGADPHRAECVMPIQHG